jgi:hypothetical protein
VALDVDTSLDNASSVALRNQRLAEVEHRSPLSPALSPGYR